MKLTDFSFLGGYPLTQEQMDFLQQAWIECVNALANRGGNGLTPFAVWGCEWTRTPAGGSNYFYSLSVGWFFYNGELVRCLGGTLTVDESTDRCFVNITTATNPLPYGDASTPGTETDKVVVTLGNFATATPDDADKFKIDHLLNQHWKVPVYSGTFQDSASPIRYRMDVMTKEVMLKGVCDNSSPAGLAINTVVFNLPAGYRPAQEQLYPALDSLTPALVAVRVKTNGDVCIAADVINAPNQSIHFNLKVPLG